MSIDPHRNSDVKSFCIFAIGLLAGLALDTIRTTNLHKHDAINDLPFNGILRTRLSDLPNGIFSLMDDPDSDLEEIESMDLAFDDTSREIQHFEIDGFERFNVSAIEGDDAAIMESLVFYLTNSSYHSLQLLHSYDHETGKDGFVVSLHDDDSTHLMLDAGRNSHRARRLGACKDCVKKLKLNRCKSCAKKVTDFEKKIKDMDSAINKVKKDLNNAKNEVNRFKNEAKDAANQVSKLTKEVADLKEIKNGLEDTVKDVRKTLNSIPNTLQREIVDPIVDEINKAERDLSQINKIANSVADSTVRALKKLDFLPKAGEQLGKYMGDALVNFLSQDFCVPYDCIADKFDVDISDIELYSSEKVSLTTSLVPNTCLQITSVDFDTSKLDDFLDLFKDLEALDDIFDAVKDFLKDQMKEITKLDDDIEKLLEDIKKTANNAADILGVRRRRLITGGMGRRLMIVGDDGVEEEASMEDLSAIAYQKGLDKYQELWGTHVKQVFHERNLADNAAKYIGFESLVLELSQGFSQSFTLEASDRAGYSGALFDEAMHESHVFPVPMTGGMMKVSTAGSIEAKMPYSMLMEAAAVAIFEYDIGEMRLSIDVISGEVTTAKEPFVTSFDIAASAGVSGFMSLNFAASASLGVCLGPTDEACVIVTIDTSQVSAAGFDAIAGINLDKNLTAMYTDEINYEDGPLCEGQLSIGAGYWQYIKEPSVEVSITGSTPCVNKNDILYSREGKLLQHSIDNWCIETELML